MCREIFLETNYNIDELTAFVSQNEPILVPDQRDTYNYILSFSETNKGGIVFLDAPGGTGKTFLLTIGDGKAPVNSTTGQITFPSNFCCIVTSIEELKAKVFPNIQLHFKNSGWLCERAILAPKNDSVNKINLQILNLLPGVCTTYKSVDTVIDPAQALFYPTEFLNSLEPQGLPPHNLFLKPGAPILLLRNLDPLKLCNGPRLFIKNLFPHVIEATILTGCATGEDVFIPTIPLIPSDLPFDFKRLQFPIRLAFAMSINKAQGQSLKVVGIDLQSPCFSHGQLYVALFKSWNSQKSVRVCT
ncbi:ATP-dependent DNA helicase PIF1-like [Phyllobates terribilis]|uniref:ATP-dependent DNA helicase PIF1-like n=1 Tax=Phyllobates terribilis TaxID=111132 RepID=UPI003CCB4FD4